MLLNLLQLLQLTFLKGLCLSSDFRVMDALSTTTLTGTGDSPYPAVSRVSRSFLLTSFLLLATPLLL